MSDLERRTSIWAHLRRILEHLRGRSRQGAEARRVDRERARFWAEVHDGEREAEARSGS